MRAWKSLRCPPPDRSCGLCGPLAREFRPRPAIQTPGGTASQRAPTAASVCAAWAASHGPQSLPRMLSAGYAPLMCCPFVASPLAVCPPTPSPQRRRPWLSRTCWSGARRRSWLIWASSCSGRVLEHRHATMHPCPWLPWAVFARMGRHAGTDPTHRCPGRHRRKLPCTWTAAAAARHWASTTVLDESHPRWKVPGRRALRRAEMHRDPRRLTGCQCCA